MLQGNMKFDFRGHYILNPLRSKISPTLEPLNKSFCFLRFNEALRSASGDSPVKSARASFDTQYIEKKENITLPPYISLVYLPTRKLSTPVSLTCYTVSQAAQKVKTT